MKQIINNLKTGNVNLIEVPTPKVGEGEVLIKTTHSLVSLGTERMLVEFGKASLLQKAKKQPEKVKEVLAKINSDGLKSTIEAVSNKLDQPLELGYCNVGVVIEVGVGVFEISIGDRVASNGPHAEIVSVSKNLIQKIPDSVNDEEACFTVVGSIGLQGIRLIKPNFGETIVVIGLGLIGLITCQLLKANGCKVIGLDVDKAKCDLGVGLGIKTINSNIDDPIKSVLELTDQIGADGVIITASSKSNNVISQSAQMSRKRGRIVLIGVVGLEINRADFYEKELTFQVSCSYGPGRYDDKYEEEGIDYPLPFVRWTEKRNFSAILEAIRAGILNVKSLITNKVPFSNYNKIYDTIGLDKSVASLLIYNELNKQSLISKVINVKKVKFSGKKGVVGIIGAGNFTNMTLLPILKNTGAHLKYIASLGGLSGTHCARKYGISKSTTDYEEILKDKEVDTVIITTRHDSHAAIILDALSANKNVFVEKPLAINNSQLDKIVSFINNKEGASLMVGFNRRFSMHLKAISKSLGNSPRPINIIANMNAGFIPKEHWVNNLQLGGGRIIGEACHLIDVCVFLTGSLVESVCINSLGKSGNINSDNVSILLKFNNGSNAVINYFSNGSKKYSKERIEVYSDERTWIVDNFNLTKAFGVSGFKKIKTKSDKGHKSQFLNYIKTIQNGGYPLIPFEQLVNVSRASFAAIESLQSRRWVKV